MLPPLLPCESAQQPDESPAESAQQQHVSQAMAIIDRPLQEDESQVRQLLSTLNKRHYTIHSLRECSAYNPIPTAPPERGYLPLMFAQALDSLLRAALCCAKIVRYLFCISCCTLAHSLRGLHSYFAVNCTHETGLACCASAAKCAAPASCRTQLHEYNLVCCASEPAGLVANQIAVLRLTPSSFWRSHTLDVCPASPDLVLCRCWWCCHLAQSATRTLSMSCKSAHPPHARRSTGMISDPCFLTKPCPSYLPETVLHGHCNQHIVHYVRYKRPY